MGKFMKLKKALLVFCIVLNAFLLLFSVTGIFIEKTIASCLFFLFFSAFFILVILICIKKIKNQEKKIPRIQKILLPSFIFLAFVSIAVFIKPTQDTGKNDKNDIASSIVTNEVSEENFETIEMKLIPVKGNDVISETLVGNDVSQDSEVEKETQNESSQSMLNTQKTFSSKQVVENPTIIEKSSVKQKVKVYVGSNGKKYHERYCRTLKKSDTLTEYTVSDAKRRHYTACKVCCPPEED